MLGKSTATQGLSKQLKAFDLFTIGFGAIIGVGWILVIGDWVNQGGGRWLRRSHSF